MLGFGFLIAFDEAPLDFRSSWWLVPVAQSLVAAPFVVRIVAPALRSIDPRLREVAATLGASPSRSLARDRRCRSPAARSPSPPGSRSRSRSASSARPCSSPAPSSRRLPVAIFRFLGRPGAENQGVAAALAVVLAGIAVCAALAAERVADGRGRAL